MQLDESRMAQAEMAEMGQQCEALGEAHRAELARAKAEHEALMDERSQKWSADLRTVTDR